MQSPPCYRLGPFCAILPIKFYLSSEGLARTYQARYHTTESEEEYMSAQAAYKSPLHKMSAISKTALWNDSCSIEELTYAIEHGAVGATANPVIVGEVLKKEMPLWKERIGAMLREMPRASEEELGWKLVEEMSAKAAALLKPIYDKYKGWNGRLSVPPDPRLHRDGERITEQAVQFGG